MTDSAHGHLHHALVAVRLRDTGRDAHALGQVPDGDFFHASLMSAHHPARDVSNADAALELRTSSGAESLHLVAGEDHVLTLRAW